MPDLAHTGCLILWGYNPNHTRLSHATLILEALKRGTKLIVVDPRRAGFANRADVWLRVRPRQRRSVGVGHCQCHDPARLVRPGFSARVEQWAVARARRQWPLFDRARCVARGFIESTVRMGHGGESPDGLRSGDRPVRAAAAGIALEGEYRAPTPSGDTLCRPAFQLYTDLCHCYSPDTVAAPTWVGAAQIEETARLLWHARPVSYYAYSGHEQHANVTQTARAMSLLYALTGSFDAEGGNVMFPTVSAASIIGEDLPNTKHLAPVVASKPDLWGRHGSG